MPRRFVTVDVFTDQKFGGNPLAVVLDAEGLDEAAMQALAREFNYSETTFVLPPEDADHAARVRIFTVEKELPFAGHPNVGTAWVLAREAERRGEGRPSRLVFEEAAGLVSVEIGEEGSCELMAPQPLGLGAVVAAEDAARCVGLPPASVRQARTASVGLPFLMVELVSIAALRAMAPDMDAYRQVLAPLGAESLYAFTREAAGGLDLRARMFFSPAAEDPATGSAAAALIALLCQADGADALSLRLGQGGEMGRPSVLEVRAERWGGDMRGFVGGRCAGVFEGVFDL